MANKVMTTEQIAARRLRQIAATALPTPVACAASIHELEGEAIARSAPFRIVLLGGQETRGGLLAPREEVEKILRSRGLEPVWAASPAAVPADAEVVVTTGSPVGLDVLSKAPKLRLVAAAFTGVDHIDLPACKARGITVTNVPGYSTDATAELAIALILSQLRRLPETFQSVHAGRWIPPLQEDLASKVVGIVGVGKIGIRVAELLKAFKVKGLLGYSLTQDPAFTALGGTFADSLAGLFLEADVVVVCTPLNEGSKGLITCKLMELLRPDNLLVNVARGDVIDEAALATFLSEGRFRAALDVVSQEPLPADSPLRNIPSERLLITPHVGFQSQGALAKRLDTTVKNILAFLAGLSINVVH